MCLSMFLLCIFLVHVSARLPFSWQMAGALVLANDPIQGTPQQLVTDHFSYIGNYGVNGCNNNNSPYSCTANQCQHPGTDLAEILPYPQLAKWLQDNQNAGLYVGLWGATYNNIEAEAACMAEVANTLRSTYKVTLDFFIIDGEKTYETFQNYSQRFVNTFNEKLQFTLNKAYTPECHTAVPVAPWLQGGFTSIMPMAYWNSYNVPPSYCIRWLMQYGVPTEKIQVMLDGYSHGVPHYWEEYAEDQLSEKTLGFSIWRTLHTTEWDSWKLIMQNTSVAIY